MFYLEIVTLFDMLGLFFLYCRLLCRYPRALASGRGSDQAAMALHMAKVRHVHQFHSTTCSPLACFDSLARTLNLTLLYDCLSFCSFRSSFILSQDPTPQQWALQPRGVWRGLTTARNSDLRNNEGSATQVSSLLSISFSSFECGSSLALLCSLCVCVSFVFT